MNSRFNTNYPINSRFPHHPSSALPRNPDSHDPLPRGAHASAVEVPDIEISASGIPVTELVGFALTCIEKLTSPGSNDEDQDRPLEETILIVVAEQLPSYITLKADLQLTQQIPSKSCVRTAQQQHRAKELHQRLEIQEEAIAQHLIATGEEIGLPTPLLTQLANLTKTILQRCCV